MVATTGFGLGVNPGKVDEIVFSCVPLSLESFFQQAGRGVRRVDGVLNVANVSIIANK